MVGKVIGSKMKMGTKVSWKNTMTISGRMKRKHRHGPSSALRVVDCRKVPQKERGKAKVSKEDDSSGPRKAKEKGVLTPALKPVGKQTLPRDDKNSVQKEARETRMGKTVLTAIRHELGRVQHPKMAMLIKPTMTNIPKKKAKMTTGMMSQKVGMTLSPLIGETGISTLDMLSLNNA